MQVHDLPMTLREKPGSAEARQLRKAGRLPAVLYGLNRATVSLTVEEDQFRKLFETARAGHQAVQRTDGVRLSAELLNHTQPDGDRFVYIVQFVGLEICNANQVRPTLLRNAP